MSAKGSQLDLNRVEILPYSFLLTDHQQYILVDPELERTERSRVNSSLLLHAGSQWLAGLYHITLHLSTSDLQGQRVASSKQPTQTERPSQPRVPDQEPSRRSPVDP